MLDKERGASLLRLLVVLVLFGSVVGYLESATVVYIRTLYVPIHQRTYPDRAPDDLFPMISLDRWKLEAPPETRSPVLEASREVCTVVAVGLVALAVSSTWRCWAAAFFLQSGFAGWSYYLGLKALIGWPHSASDLDLIFMVPVPSAGPVWAALVGYTAMIVAAVWFYRGEASGRPLHAGWIGWTLLVTGTLLMAAPFFLDTGRLMASEYPEPFQGWLLVPGLLLVFAGMSFAARRVEGRRQAGG